MTYVIRDYRDGDAPALADLTLAAIRAVGAHSYSPAQVAVWAARHPGAERFESRVGQGHHISVAVSDDGEVVAYSLLEPDGHLDMLYCHPDHTRRGIADKLLSHSERVARENSVSHLYTEASDLARPAFERAGYRVEERRDFEIDGVAIHNFAMTKAVEGKAID